MSVQASLYWSDATRLLLGQDVTVRVTHRVGWHKTWPRTT
jgi:hypothetical protein